MIFKGEIDILLVLLVNDTIIYAALGLEQVPLMEYLFHQRYSPGQCWKCIKLIPISFNPLMDLGRGPIFLFQNRISIDLANNIAHSKLNGFYYTKKM